MFVDAGISQEKRLTRELYQILAERFPLRPHVCDSKQAELGVDVADLDLAWLNPCDETDMEDPTQTTAPLSLGIASQTDREAGPARRAKVTRAC